MLGHGAQKVCHLMESITAGKALRRACSVFFSSTDGTHQLHSRLGDGGASLSRQVLGLFLPHLADGSAAA